jgi:hypothetical protein
MVAVPCAVEADASNAIVGLVKGANENVAVGWPVPTFTFFVVL